MAIPYGQAVRENKKLKSLGYTTNQITSMKEKEKKTVFKYNLKPDETVVTTQESTFTESTASQTQPTPFVSKKPVVVTKKDKGNNKTEVRVTTLREDIEIKNRNRQNQIVSKRLVPSNAQVVSMSKEDQMKSMQMSVNPELLKNEVLTWTNTKVIKPVQRLTPSNAQVVSMSKEDQMKSMQMSVNPELLSNEVLTWNETKIKEVGLYELPDTTFKDFYNSEIDKARKYKEDNYGSTRIATEPADLFEGIRSAGLGTKLLARDLLSGNEVLTPAIDVVEKYAIGFVGGATFPISAISSIGKNIKQGTPLNIIIDPITSFVGLPLNFKTDPLGTSAMILGGFKAGDMIRSSFKESNIEKAQKIVDARAKLVKDDTTGLVIRKGKKVELPENTDNIIRSEEEALAVFRDVELQKRYTIDMLKSGVRIDKYKEIKSPRGETVPILKFDENALTLRFDTEGGVNLPKKFTVNTPGIDDVDIGVNFELIPKTRLNKIAGTVDARVVGLELPSVGSVSVSGGRAGAGGGIAVLDTGFFKQSSMPYSLELPKMFSKQKIILDFDLTSVTASNSLLPNVLASGFSQVSFGKTKQVLSQKNVQTQLQKSVSSQIVNQSLFQEQKQSSLQKSVQAQMNSMSQVMKLGSSQALKQSSVQKSVQAQMNSMMQTQVQSQIQSQIQTQVQSQTQTQVNIINTEIIKVIPPIIPPFKLPKISFSRKGGKQKDFFGNITSKYTPTLSGAGLNIFGKVNKKDVYIGGIRPIPLSYKKKKKSKRKDFSNLLNLNMF